MKIRQIIIMVQSFGHFNRSTLLEVNSYLFSEEHETLSDHCYDQVIMKLRTFFLTLCQNIYMHEISTNFKTGLTRYNV